ncbi:MAG: family transcriptional regulator [Nocardioides sp.]|uniref:helix-turn-helix domain-containing protein n=1 Tax=Nocardioides sp. TaxID=35761 RepID=UPI002624B3CE|nr:hypothetical protein [Nocardioides sp.]MCW2834814.1 family transcriptional regulator [Nocardioides sp.]
MKVTAKVQRSGDWWAIEVPEIEGVFTQAKRLDQVADTVTDAVRTILDLDGSAAIEVEVLPEIDDALKRMVDQAVLASAQASAAQDEASKATRHAVAVLRDQGLPVRDVAELLHVSHQRVSQLSKPAPSGNYRASVTYTRADVGKTSRAGKPESKDA